MVVARNYTVGDSRFNNKGERFTIIDWHHAHKVLVEFDNGEVVETTSSAVNSGRILNMYYPTVKGFGIPGDWLNSERDCTCREYYIWTSMIDRVINPNSKNWKRYNHCKIADEWKYLKNFGQWITNLPQWEYEDWQLDKDISGENLYSEDTCFLIPASINAMITRRGGRVRSSKLPRSVRKVGNSYVGRYGSGENEKSKCFSNAEDA